MVGVKIEGLAEAAATVNPARVIQAASLALNDAARSGRTESGREIRRRWNVQASKINAELRNVKFARRDDLSAIIQAKGRPISLTYFGAKEVRNVGGRVLVQDRRSGRFLNRSTAKRGVTVRILKGKTTHLPKAFIATMNSGYVGVFSRIGGRRKLASLSIITVASMFQQEPVQRKTIESAMERWRERFGHYFDRLTGPSVR